jgi:hypothetical protein
MVAILTIKTNKRPKLLTAILARVFLIILLIATGGTA